MNFGRSGGTLCTVHSFDNKTKSTINGLPFREQCIKKKIFSNIQYTIYNMYKERFPQEVS